MKSLLTILMLMVIVISIFVGLSEYEALTDVFIDQGEDPYLLFQILIVVSIVIFVAIIPFVYRRR